MRILARGIVVAAVGAAAATSLAAIDRPPKQVQIEAKFVEASDAFAREVGLFWRLGADGKPDLLLSLPAAVDRQAVDRVTLSVGRGAAQGARPALLPPRWTLDTKRELLILGGPPVVDAPRVAVALDLETNLTLAPKVVLSSGGRILLEVQPEIRSLNPTQTVTDLSAVLWLPRRIRPGDTLELAPLDPQFTPGGGTWTIGGLVPRWNGDFARPRYELTLPESLATSVGEAWNVRAEYVDPWGSRLVDAHLQRTTIEPPRLASDRPRVSGCSAAVLDGGPLCVCGEFPPGSLDGLTLAGRPLAPYVVSRSPTLLGLLLPADLPAGRFEIGAAAGSSYEVADGTGGVLMRVRGEIDRDLLRRGQSTTLRLSLEGTDRPAELRLWNSTPGIVTLEGGNDQRVTTSGGSPNDVVRAVHAVTPGDFALHYELTIDSCACGAPEDSAAAAADGRDEPDGDDYGDYPQYELGDDYPELVDGSMLRTCERRLAEYLERTRDLAVRDDATDRLADQIQREVEELDGFLEEIRPRIDDYRREAAHYSLKYEFLWPKTQIARYDKLRGIVAQLAFLDGRLTLLPREGGSGAPAPDACLARTGACDELRRQAEAAEAEARRRRAESESTGRPWAEYAAETRQLEVLRRQAAAYRELERSALDRSATAAERARANPGVGHERAIASAQKDAAGYVADAERLEAQAKALELRIARDSVLADWFRQQAGDAKRQADEAERRARAARLAYQSCLDAAIAACDDGAPPAGGGASSAPRPGAAGTEERPREPDGGGGPQEDRPHAPELETPKPKANGESPAPTSPGEETSERRLAPRCGPDVTPAFERALANVARRVRTLPEAATGYAGGNRFLESNWPTYWHDPGEEGGGSASRDDGHWDWDDLIWWSNEAWRDVCNQCVECQNTNWLWGRCLHSDLVVDIFEDSVAEIFHASLARALRAAAGVELRPTSPGEPSREVAAALADVLDAQSGTAAPAAGGEALHRALQAAFDAALDRLGTDPVSWWGASCEKCEGYALSRFRDDWSEEDWVLPDGSTQHRDGSISKLLIQRILDLRDP